MSFTAVLQPQMQSLVESANVPLRGLQAAVWYAKFFFDPIGCLTDANRRFGSVASAGRLSRIFGAERQHVLAMEPALNRQVLGNPSVYHTTAQSWAGSRTSALRRIRNGLTRMNGEKYQQQRQLLLPTFSKKAVEGYVAEMGSVMSQVLDEQWRAGQTVDIYRQLRETTVRISSQILFGRLPPDEARTLAKLGQDFIPRTFSPGVWLCPFDLPLTPFRHMRRNAEAIEQFLLSMIEKRRAEPSQYTDVLNTLVTAFDQQSVPMDYSDLIGQATIMFVASYENVASVLTWAMLLLAQHPHAMSELHDELSGALGDAPPTADQLEHLPYLDAVVKESMRVLPPVPFLVRKVMEPTNLGGFELRKNDRVAVSPYITHHSPEIYSQPRRFLPERWFQIKPDPYEYLPFGAGPRACIGKTFAMREIKVALAMIVKRFRFSVPADTRIDRRVQIMMSPKHGLPMTIHPQDGNFQSSRLRGNIHEMVDLPN